MDYRTLIIRNRVKVDLNDDLALFKEYEEKNTPLKHSFGFIDTDYGDLKHISFIRSNGVNILQDWYGLEGVRERIKPLVQESLYHQVVFVYDLKDTGFQGMVGHWTHFAEVWPGTEFIEIAVTDEWDKVGDFLRVLTHETRHAFVNRARRRGRAVIDVMDRTPVFVDCKNKQPVRVSECLENVPYYKEYDVYATDGNRATQTGYLAPFWEDIAYMDVWYVRMIKQIAELTSQVLSLRKQINDVTAPGLLPEQEKPMKTNLVNEWVRAIRTHEGWFPGSWSYRNNNPGNLRYSPFEIGKAGGFSVFKSVADGERALKYQLQLVVKGRSPAYNAQIKVRQKEIGGEWLSIKDCSKLSLRQFTHIYAPSRDNNNPERYAKAVAKELGVDVNMSIKDIWGDYPQVV